MCAKKKKSEKDLVSSCIECGARCCKYLALEIDEPDCSEEYEKIRWYLAHENTWVFTDDGAWYLMTLNRCSFLGEDNLCTIYDRRPQICRDHDHSNCERDGSVFYDELFKTMADFEQWLEQHGK